jgi:hypothetical protein
MYHNINRTQRPDGLRPRDPLIIEAENVCWLRVELSLAGSDCLGDARGPAPSNLGGQPLVA